MNLKILLRLFKALILRKNPNYLIVFINGACNLNCSFCCDSARSVREIKDIDSSIWERSLGGLDALIHLTITGGEPFLRPDLYECVFKMLKITGVPRLSINTNGFYTEKTFNLAKSILKEFPKIDFSISISIDGHESVHDKLRMKDGSYKAAFETIQKLAPLKKLHPNFNLKVASLLQPGNDKELESFFKETENWPIDFHELIFPRDIPLSTQTGLKEKYKKLSSLQLSRAKAKFKKTSDWAIYKALNKKVIKAVNSTKPFKCSAGSNLVEILPDGRVIGCELKKVKNSSYLGNIQEKTLLEILSDKPAHFFRNKIAKKCNCTFECAAASNAVFKPKNWPNLIYGYFSKS